MLEEVVKEDDEMMEKQRGGPEAYSSSDQRRGIPFM